VNRVASITISPGETEVERENLQNMGAVTARLNSRDLGGVIQDIQAKLSGRVTLPPGYHIQYGGSTWSSSNRFRSCW
jgi:Cu/Ag efflux pump CusA